MAAVTTAPVSKLIKVGFSPRGAALLTAATPDYKTALRTGALSYRQVRTLMRGGTLTLAVLLKGGFTRAQAKLILGL